MLQSIPFLFCAICALNSLAQSKEPFYVNKELTEIYADALQLNFDAADDKLQRASIRNNALRHLTANLNDFLKIFVTEDRQLYEKLSKQKIERLKALDKADQTSPFYLYSIAEINLQWAILRIKFNDRFKALIELRKALSHIEKNNTLFPDFYLNLKVNGLLKAFSGAIPENYHWISEFLGFKGSVKEGLDDLKLLEKKIKADSPFHFLLTEAVFFQAFITLNLLGEPPDFAYWYRKLDRLKIKGPLIQFCGASIAAKERNMEKMAQYLNQPDQQLGNFCYLHFLRGELALYRGEKNADTWFHRYLNCFKGSTYVKAAYQKIAWNQLLQNDIKGYYNSMILVRNEGKAETDEDKMALAEANSLKKPHPELLSVRLLFDSGQYSEALHKIHALNPTKDLLYEYHYRLGRILHLRNELDEALSHYELSIRYKDNDSDYYAASALFYSGEIHLSRADKALAKTFFTKVLQEKNHPYKNSLDAKAKSRLQLCD